MQHPTQGALERAIVPPQLPGAVVAEGVEAQQEFRSSSGILNVIILETDGTGQFPGSQILWAVRRHVHGSFGNHSIIVNDTGRSAKHIRPLQLV